MEVYLYGLEYGVLLCLLGNIVYFMLLYVIMMDELDYFVDIVVVGIECVL